MTPKKMFEAYYGSVRNAMTPIVAQHGWLLKGKYAFELSRSKDGRLYGVTVLTYDSDGNITSDRSMRFSGTKEDVTRHIQTLKDELSNK